jgi:diacylglycerol kinase (ATP)
VKAILLYNPRAGAKRRLNPLQSHITLDDIRALLNKYDLPVEERPTEYAGHEREIARQAVNAGTELLIVAAGDGTVGEVMNELVGKSITLAILPMGTVMNLTRMLGIPFDLEEAIKTIKMGRQRVMDVGAVTILNGQKLATPYYFSEQAGVDFTATFHHEQVEIFEHHKWSHITKLFRIIWGMGNHHFTLVMDGQEKRIRATVVTVANGPLSGPALETAPSAKLNDNALTVSIVRLSRGQILRRTWSLLWGRKAGFPKAEVHQVKSIAIQTPQPRRVHADARLFGYTPVEFKAQPRAIRVITGFPDASKPHALKHD